jgi:transcriptional regulator with XRE-family HTH domain
VKSGSSSAVAFGTVLRAVRKRSSKNQSDIAAVFSPKLSVAAVSMAESGNRPPKTTAMVRTYAAALELDADDLVELWWAMQGMVEVEDKADENIRQQWWRQLRANDRAHTEHSWADDAARKVWTPNEDFRAPLLQLFALAEEICMILRRLLGDTWEIGYKSEIGLYEPIEGYPAKITIELRAGKPQEDSSMESQLMAAFVCPEPIARPISPAAAMRPKTGTMLPDVAWILSSVEAMPARERAAVAGFIQGLREGAGLFPETSIPPRDAR